MERDYRAGQKPESELTPHEIYNRSITKLKRHNAGSSERSYRHHLPYNEIVPTVLTATDAAVQMQEGTSSNISSLRTHQRLSTAYAEGAKAMGDSPIGASFMTGYIEHTQRVVELQTKVRKTVFPDTEHQETGR